MLLNLAYYSNTKIHVIFPPMENLYGNLLGNTNKKMYPKALQISKRFASSFLQAETFFFCQKSNTLFPYNNGKFPFTYGSGKMKLFADVTL